MKKGDVVMIYQDPLTQEKEEGQARLIRCVGDQNDGCCTEYWQVKFLGDGYVVHRMVKREAA